jgi:hypothetical protein
MVVKINIWHIRLQLHSCSHPDHKESIDAIMQEIDLIISSKI